MREGQCQPPPRVPAGSWPVSSSQRTVALSALVRSTRGCHLSTSLAFCDENTVFDGLYSSASHPGGCATASVRLHVGPRLEARPTPAPDVSIFISLASPRMTPLRLATALTCGAEMVASRSSRSLNALAS